MSARDCAMAILWRAGRLRPARLERGGSGAAQAADGTGPSTRADGVGAQVVEVEMRALEGADWAPLGAEAVCGMVEGGGGGGTVGGGGLEEEERDRAAVAELRRESECPKAPPLLAPEVEFLCGESTRERDGGWGSVREYEWLRGATLGLGGLGMGGGFRPRVCAAMPGVLTPRTSMHC